MSCPLYIDQSFEENWRNPPEEDGELGDPARFLELPSLPTSPLAEGPPKSPNGKNKNIQTKEPIQDDFIKSSITDIQY